MARDSHSTIGHATSVALALVLMLLTFEHRAVAQDFSLPGPFAVGSLSQQVTIKPPSGAPGSKGVDLDVIVTFPASGAAPFPVVALFNGFQAKAPWYSATARHLASWGYVVLQYTSPGFMTIVTDAVELGYLQPLLDWLQAQGAAVRGPLKGLPDTSKLATMGHSRGGKLAALHLAGRSDVAAAVLVDPVDNSKFSPESPDYPSAVKALGAANRTAGLIGAGITGNCNPAGSNYPLFFDALAPNSWQMVISKAGHMQFARTGSSVMDWGLDKLCGKGKTSAEEVIRGANTFAVAWLQSAFRKAQSQTGLAAFQQWVKLQSDRGAISFTVKGGSAS